MNKKKFITIFISINIIILIILGAYTVLRLSKIGKKPTSTPKVQVAPSEIPTEKEAEIYQQQPAGPCEVGFMIEITSSPSPSPSYAPSPSVGVSPSPSSSPSPSANVNPSPSASPFISPSPSIGYSPSPSPSASVSPSASIGVSPSPSSTVVAPPEELPSAGVFSPTLILSLGGILLIGLALIL